MEIKKAGEPSTVCTFGPFHKLLREMMDGKKSEMFIV